MKKYTHLFHALLALAGAFLVASFPPGAGWARSILIGWFAANCAIHLIAFYEELKE